MTQNSGIEHVLCKFSGNTKLNSAVDMTEGKDTIQSDLDRLEKWAQMNLTEFTKS